MPKRQSLAGTFTAGKTLSMEGTTYTPGQSIPDAVVARARRASALLSSGYILSGEPDGRTGKRVPRNFVRRIRALNPAERRTLGG